MRIWQKLYLVTLLLFLASLNIGLLFAGQYIFSHNLKLEQKQAKTDCDYLCQSLGRDFAALEKKGRFQEPAVAVLLERYQSHYGDILLTLKQTERPTAFCIRSEIMDGGRKMQIFAEQSLAVPFDGYRLHFQKRLSDFEGVWLDIKRTFAIISFSVSLLLCLVLYLCTRHMLKPLGRLNERVAKIAAGEYGQAMDAGRRILGQDEIDELSISVGQMSGTIQRQIQALEEENAKKQQLTDHMAHELRTPLTSIYGYAEYLRYAKASHKEWQEGLSYIMEESRRLTKMSESLLSMRLYEKASLTASPVDLFDLSRHIEQILSKKLLEKNLTLTKQFELSTVYGERELLISLFLNLLENAVRASKPGGEILWRAYARKDAQQFEIIDHGVGMETSELSRITEAFYRTDPSRSRRDGGVGLGLSIVRLIVEKRNGELTFSSHPGEGTKATVLLQLPYNQIKRP